MTRGKLQGNGKWLIGVNNLTEKSEVLTYKGPSSFPPMPPAAVFLVNGQIAPEFAPDCRQTPQNKGGGV